MRYKKESRHICMAASERPTEYALHVCECVHVQILRRPVQTAPNQADVTGQCQSSHASGMSGI